jgi:hypothetical protein
VTGDSGDQDFTVLIETTENGENDWEATGAAQTVTGPSAEWVAVKVASYRQASDDRRPWRVRVWHGAHADTDLPVDWTVFGR